MIVIVLKGGLLGCSVTAAGSVHHHSHNTLMRAAHSALHSGLNGHGLFTNWTEVTEFIFFTGSGQTAARVCATAVNQSSTSKTR